MAGRLVVEWDPLDAPDEAEAAERATWASMRLVAESLSGEMLILTRAMDRVARLNRDQVYGPLIPVVEWIARSWNHVAGPKSFDGSRAAPYSWMRTHCLRFVGEGAALPNLCFQPYGDDHIKLVWSADDERLPYEPVVFTTSGSVVLPKAVVLDELDRLVASVLARLRETVPTDWRTARLEATWDLARNRKNPDHPAEKLGAVAGLLWADLRDESRDALRKLAGGTLDSVTRELLVFRDDRSLDDVLIEGRPLWEACRTSGHASSDWNRTRGSIAARAGGALGSLPWERGWQQAHAVRNLIALAHDRPCPNDLHEQLDVSFATPRWDAPVGDSLVAWDADHEPIRARTPGAFREPRERFLLARDLYPMLFEGATTESHARVLFEGTSGVNPVANAFATEMLAPVALLRNRLSGRKTVTEDDMAEIASEIVAPLGCVRHQIQNNGLANIDYGWL